MSSELSRNELLSKLKGISFAVFMTWLPTEMCLEITTLTAEGVGYRWIGYDDWQVFKLRKCNTDQWRTIIKKISDKTLSANDIANTDLENLVNGIRPLHDDFPDLSTFFTGLCNQESPFDECFYGLFSGNVMSFFSTQEDLREALQIEYAAVDSKWEELDVANLEYWWCRYLDEGDNLHLISFDID